MDPLLPNDTYNDLSPGTYIFTEHRPINTLGVGLRLPSFPDPKANSVGL